MDTQKDNTIKDSLSLAESKGRFSRFISLKAEKLTGALYLVTDFLSDSEPLKWKLRSRAADLLLEAGAVARRVKVFGRTGGSEAFVSLVGDISSLLEVAGQSGTVSENNFSILKKEYLDLGELVAGAESTNSLKDLFVISDLPYPKLPAVGVAAPELSPAGPLVSLAASVISNGQDKRQIKDNNFAASVKDKVSHNNGQKDGRRATIINFVKGRGWVGIADIASVISDCSTKTVQRELADMVQSGVLKKQGEKRWSKYMLP